MEEVLPPEAAGEDDTIEHLLESAGLEVTPQELQSLFDIDENNGGGNISPQSINYGGDRTHGGHGRGRGGAEGIGRRNPDSALLLFLRRRGLRRSEPTVSGSIINSFLLPFLDAPPQEEAEFNRRSVERRICKS